jgi:membrane protease YdiL (CAAX protease family)
MRSLFKFFTLTFLVSWVCWIAAAAIAGEAASRPSGFAAIRGALVFIGVIAPALVALAFTAQAEGRAGTLALLRQLTRLPNGAQWYVFALGFYAVIKLTVALLHRLAIGAWPQFGQTPFFLILAAICISTPVQAGEEIGWRGYALPRLTRRLGLANASIVLGVIWACWHLPFFLIPGSDNFGQSFPVYLLAVTALSIAMAWFYWRTGESLFLTMLMHAAINNTAGIVVSPASVTNPFSLRTTLTAWLTAALLWLCAGYFLIRMRGVTTLQATGERHGLAWTLHV